MEHAIRGELVAPAQPLYDTARMAVAGFLAAYRGNTRTGYETDLRLWGAWCAQMDLEPFEVTRAHIEIYLRLMEEDGKAKGTVARRIGTIAGWYRYRRSCHSLSVLWPLMRHKGTPEQRFWAKVNKSGPVPDYAPRLGPCWIWTASLKAGYGQFKTDPCQTSAAHRLAYEFVVGRIPDGLVLDHLCRVPACVNPSHLEPVTHGENLRRGFTFAGRNSVKTHCPQGHAYDVPNTYIDRMGRRYCRTCIRNRAFARYQKRKATAA